MGRLRQAPPLAGLLPAPGTLQGHAPHLVERSTTLSPNDSWGACTPPWDYRVTSFVHAKIALHGALPGRAGGYPPGPPTDPYVRHARIRFLGNQRLGTTLAHPCATLHGPSDGVDDLGCG